MNEIFNYYIEEAKRELGIRGWTRNWNDVINLAKEKYWKSEEFKELKEITIELGDNKCQLCDNTQKLTAHHIFYGDGERTICLCKKCHNIVHSMDNWGFVLQYVLLNIIEPDKIYPGNIYNNCNECFKKLMNEINKNKEKND